MTNADAPGGRRLPAEGESIPRYIYRSQRRRQPHHEPRGQMYRGVGTGGRETLREGMEVDYSGRGDAGSDGQGEAGEGVAVV